MVSGERCIKEVDAAWLSHLPTTLAQCAERWSLTVGAPFEPLSRNFVTPSLRADGTEVVLKLSVPNAELLTEIAALRLFNGQSMVQLLEADAEAGAILLERLKPGTPLSKLFDDNDDEQATSIAAQLMRQLWKPATSEHLFPNIQEWADGLKKMRGHFGGGTGPFSSTLVTTAETLFRELIDSMTEAVLLHGDLHHQNILAAEREPWLAIDPKGVIGEPAYEVGALLRNPMPQLMSAPQVKRILARRVDQLAAELELDRERVVGWGLAQAVLAAWWQYEDDGQGWEMWMACADVLSALR